MEAYDMLINAGFCYYYSRVSLTPAVAVALTKKGFQVKVEKGAGAEAKFRDSDYAESGAQIADRDSVFQSGIKGRLGLGMIYLYQQFVLFHRRYNPESAAACQRRNWQI